MSVSTENAIYVSDKAKAKVAQLLADAGVGHDPSYFLRVSVVGGGCSGLSYKLDFDNEFSDGLNGKGFYFSNPNASRTCGCGESFAV